MAIMFVGYERAGGQPVVIPREAWAHYEDDLIAAAVGLVFKNEFTEVRIYRTGTDVMEPTNAGVYYHPRCERMAFWQAQDYAKAFYDRFIGKE